MLYNTKEFRLRLPCGSIDCLSFGRGKRPLVMLQGLSTRGIKGSGPMLAWMYRIFAREYRVYLFDRRENVTEGITVKELAGDVADAMDALGLKSADVLGVSQGGMIAQYLAAERPELVNKLVLAVTLARNNAAVVSVIERWIALAEKGEMRGLVEDMAEKMYSGRYMRRYRAFMPLLTFLQKPKDVPRFTALAKACLSCEAFDMLEDIRCPVLVIGGGKDEIVSAEASREIAERLGCEMYMYDELGHAAYEEAADFNKRVYEFFMT